MEQFLHVLSGAVTDKARRLQSDKFRISFGCSIGGRFKVEFKFRFSLASIKISSTDL